MALTPSRIHSYTFQIRTLRRTNKDRKRLDDLLLLVVTFLKKLSIHVENKVRGALESQCSS